MNGGPPTGADKGPALPVTRIPTTDDRDCFKDQVDHQKQHKKSSPGIVSGNITSFIASMHCIENDYSYSTKKNGNYVFFYSRVQQRRLPELLTALLAM